MVQRLGVNPFTISRELKKNSNKVWLNEKYGGLKSAWKYGLLVVNKGLFINSCKKLQNYVQVV